MIKNITHVVVGAFALALAWTPVQADTLNDIRDVEKSGNAKLVQTQGNIDQLSDQSDDLVSQYREIIVENETLRTYNNQVKALVRKQEADISLVKNQIDTITLVKRQIMPLIQDMLTSLRDFVEKDLPFRRDERLARVQQLQDLMTEPDVAESERYRLLLERYATEAEYGGKIAAWTGDISVNGASIPVNLLQIGRVSLMAQSAGDNKASYWWDPEAGAWTELDSGYDGAISQAIQMAEGVTQVDLVELPFPAPKEAQ
ncbi:MAG: DUF3450 domain-containing protein [Proteobacteria bacterium]|nr:DUF3450 domain-containing protein [Pseudomonadota bacterium]